MNNSIRISCNLDNLKVFRNFVTEFLHPYAINKIVLNQIILAVDEITANLIKHANKEDESKSVKLTILQLGDTFLFELTDNGIPFDPTTYVEPDMPTKIKDKKGGGWGLFLVKQIMDKVEFSSQGNHNVCRLYKTVSKVPVPAKQD